uniref:Sodium:solute symporter family protein n=1 Tax=Roseihalotalea indica TaxID=2867963 RepID=A0AA49GQG8_9BACT|nr:sodium:solute symporter family protein [Tunicatimonas sp. TK19036]
MEVAPFLFETNFSILDWGIVITYILSMGAVGMLVNKYIHTVPDYMVGGRATGLALNTASYIGTELGLVTVMYASIEAFTRGFAYLAIPLIGLIAAFVIGKTGWVIQELRRKKLVTIPEYFEKRYNRKVRILSGVLMVLAGILNMGLFPKMGATFLTYSTGLIALGDAQMVVNLVMTLLILLVVAYTIMGGMVAVIITDYFQFMVLSIGLLLGLYFVFSDPIINWDHMVETLVFAKGEAAVNPFDPDSYGILYLIWMLVVYITSSFSWGPTASRALTGQNPTIARQTFLLGSPGQFIRTAVPALFALAAFYWFVQDPGWRNFFFPTGVAHEAAHVAEAMPLFMGKLLPSGMLGVLVAGLLAAFMSTHDSYFITWASIISRDIILPLQKRRVSQQEQIRYARVSIVLMGLFLLIWGLWYELPDSVWTYMAISTNIYLTGASAALVGGVYWKKASVAGAWAAMLGGLISLVGIFPVQIQELLPWFSTSLLGLINYLWCAFLLIVFSLLFPDPKSAVAANEEEVPHG